MVSVSKVHGQSRDDRVGFTDNIIYSYIYLIYKHTEKLARDFFLPRLFGTLYIINYQPKFVPMPNFRLIRETVFVVGVNNNNMIT